MRLAYPTEGQDTADDLEERRLQAETREEEAWREKRKARQSANILEELACLLDPCHHEKDSEFRGRRPELLGLTAKARKRPASEEEGKWLAVILVARLPETLPISRFSLQITELGTETALFVTESAPLGEAIIKANNVGIIPVKAPGGINYWEIEELLPPEEGRELVLESLRTFPVAI
ncbi:MAG: hypothetical protein WC565_03720 [Parcubacteria group bacterium]